MQWNYVTSRIKLISRVNSLHTVFLNHFFRTESIESKDFHTEPLGYASHVATYITISVNTQFLTLQFRTRSTVIHIADSHHHHTESKFGYGIRVLSRSVHYAYTMSSGSFQVYIIVTCTCTYYNLQFFCSVQYCGIYNVATDNDGIGILHCVQQLGFFCIFLQQGMFITCRFNFFANTVYSYFSERFVGCN